MLKSATALMTALTAGWVLLGSPTSASAHEDCEACKPTHETHVKTIEKEGKTITITHRRVEVKPVKVPHWHHTILRIRPINHIHEVTIVDHYLRPVPENHYTTTTEWLPPVVRGITHERIDHYHGCGCGHLD
jgi:hypothetical protein